MIEIAQKLHQELKQHIHELDFNGISGLDYYKRCYQLSCSILKRLRAALSEYKFKNPEKEIEFFKFIKPRLHSEVLFYLELYRMELNCPSNRDKKAQLSYLKQLSVYYAQLLNNNCLLKLYFLTERCEEDNMLFLRSSSINSFIPFDPLQEFDSLFPPASTEFARIIAYQRVLDEISEKTTSLRKGSKEIPRAMTALTWTGTKMELVELGYALHSAKSLNNGKVELKKIMMGLEQLFNIEIGQYSRYYQNLLIRKGSRTPYTEKLIEDLSQRMEDSDLGK
ncbi:RteC domain-containing protein [Sphingobacterium sp. UBA5670]|uniref:RteC domain-containing protein n=1 Tax=Sphingobacterium sp. UBA5670 TaxID=1947502 RepID=UPI0025FE2728|nr:RteC domain-containing protein [Sphingobacterium sp. UBA5670]